MPWSRWVTAGGTLMAGTLLLASCGDDEPKTKDAPNATSANAAHTEKWLQPGSKLSPAQWMASRKLPEVKPPHDPEVMRIAANLDAANKLYRESERMIANRAVQLEDMLQDMGVTETAADILADLTRVAGEAGQTEGFGAVSQHYYNLRSHQTGRGEALAALTHRYGARR